MYRRTHLRVLGRASCSHEERRGLAYRLPFSAPPKHPVERLLAILRAFAYLYGRRLTFENGLTGRRQSHAELSDFQLWCGEHETREQYCHGDHVYTYALRTERLAREATALIARSLFAPVEEPVRLELRDLRRR